MPGDFHADGKLDTTKFIAQTLEIAPFASSAARLTRKKRFLTDLSKCFADNGGQG